MTAARFARLHPATLLRPCYGMRYDMRPDAVGWTVFDVMSGRAVVVEDVALVELELDTADELCDLLNRADLKQNRVARDLACGAHTIG